MHLKRHNAVVLARNCGYPTPLRHFVYYLHIATTNDYPSTNEQLLRLAEPRKFKEAKVDCKQRSKALIISGRAAHFLLESRSSSPHPIHTRLGCILPSPVKSVQGVR
jgi:hypothetical protein